MHTVQNFCSYLEVHQKIFMFKIKMDVCAGSIMINNPKKCSTWRLLAPHCILQILKMTSSPKHKDSHGIFGAVCINCHVKSCKVETRARVSGSSFASSLHQTTLAHQIFLRADSPCYFYRICRGDKHLLFSCSFYEIWPLATTIQEPPKHWTFPFSQIKLKSDQTRWNKT